MCCDSAHEAMETYKKASKGEIARLELALRKAELEVKSLQQTVEQKVGSFIHKHLNDQSFLIGELKPWS